ncbi:hypothetical protein AAY473_020179 [Plecturocebus cupreus]
MIHRRNHQVSTVTAKVRGGVVQKPPREPGTYEEQGCQRFPAAAAENGFCPLRTPIQSPSPRLECGGVISAHCNCCLSASSAHYRAQLVFVFLVETGFRHVGQADLELPTSGVLLTSVFQSVGIIGISYCARPHLALLTKLEF